MIVDAFLANTEWDLVVFRARYLAPSVDKFYIGESSVTFSGMEKDAFFSQRAGELTRLGFCVEVIEIAVPQDVLDQRDRWSIETYARNRFLQTVAEKHPHDLILFSDVDEIPSLDQVQRLETGGRLTEILSVPTQVCMRRANWVEFLPEKWGGKWGNALSGELWIPRIRRGRYRLAPGEPGAHLSYVGMDASTIRGKYQAFSHGELDRDDVASEELLSFCDLFHISHLGRALEPGAGLLSVAKEDELNDVQQAVARLKPEWCDFNSVAMPRHRRLIASWLVFSVIRGREGTNLAEAFAPLYSLKWLRHAFVYASVWIGWRFLTATGVLRVIRGKASNGST